MDNSDNIIEIQNEYKKIDYKWLQLHFKLSVGLVLFSLFVEIVIGVLMCNSDELNTTIPIFLMKFLIIPFALNILCILIDYKVIGTKRISQEIKVYIVSMLMVVISFVLFTVHVAFSALCFIFAVPILLTIIYANYRLTIITAISSMTSLIISELFIKWDKDKVSIFEDVNIMGDFIISLFILLAFSAVCMVVIQFEKEKNAASIQKEMERHQLQIKLQIDELTGIYNRIAFRNALKDMEEDVSDNLYIFVMIDIDNFKNLNDTHGHMVGDQCLIEFGKILTANCVDAIPFRYGGDEFCILFKNHSINQVLGTCQKIKNDFANCNVCDTTKVSLTSSFGIAMYVKNMLTTKLIANTDKALYEAKTVKNAICIYRNKEKNILHT